MSKRRVGLFAALIAAVAALLFISSGCGGGATKSGGLEKLDGPAILEKAKTAAAAKKSVHINIKQVESGATSVIDVGFADGASGGTFDTPEAKFSFTIIGDTIHVKGDEGFLKGILGQAYTPAIAAKVTGKYISGPKSSPSLGSLSDFADMSEILNSVLSPEGTVTAVGAKEIDGIDTIGISSKKVRQVGHRRGHLGTARRPDRDAREPQSRLTSNGASDTGSDALNSPQCQENRGIAGMSESPKSLQS